MKYEFDTPLDELEQIKDLKGKDLWFCMTREDNKVGADFNYCIDEDGNNQSAFYSALPAFEGTEVLYTSCTDFESYNIDFNDYKWKEKLIQKMIQFCEERAV